MSSLELQQIAGVSSAPVVFVNGISGDGHALTFPPKIVSISPAPFQKNAPISSNIVITFDQDIRFSPFTGEAIFNIRENTINGPIKESFSIHNPVTGISPRISIGGSTLTIDPTTNFAYGKKYYLEMPNIGIAATLHLALFAGEDAYYFETPFEPMDATGGNTYQYSSYRYHVFTGSGTFQLNVPSESNSGFYYLVVGGGGSGGSGNPGPTRYVGGGGGGGGVLYGPGTNLKLSAGSYTVTVGAGGANTPPGSPPVPGSYDGTPSSIKQGSNTIVEALGGGAGGGGPSPGEIMLSRVGGSGGGGSGWASAWSNRPVNSGTFDPSQDWHPQSGGGRWPDPQFPTYYYRGTRERGGRRGTPGQGNNGGYASSGRSYDQQRVFNGGGGGGAGGNGGNAPYPNYPWSPTQYNWPQYSQNPIWGAHAGDGGPGVSVPQFAAPRIPTSYMPQPVRTETGPTGLYGAGGGGGSGNSGGYPGYYFTFAGQGGPGGGGHGGGTYPRPGYGSPQRFSPETGNEWMAQTGYAMLGGGGGGGSSYPSPDGMTGRSGGSGVVMIRYLYPHVNT